MRGLLRGTTGLISAGLVLGGPIVLAHPAAAADPIKLTVGGFFREAYMVVFDDDDELEAGNERNTDGFFNDAEIHFVGSTVLDNGLEVGARVELEGETDEDQIDESWIWFSGGFGELRIGSDDEALANTCIVPPGGTTNFSAFSPNQWGANGGQSNAICTGVDAKSDAQKILYITPVFYGFQLTASYTPEEFSETHVDTAGPHLGMPFKFEDDPDYGVSAYLTYSYEGEDWGLTWGGGVSLENGSDTISGGGISFATNDQDFYQTGLNLRFGNFAIGGAFEYMNDISNVTVKSPGSSVHIEQDSWIAGGGASYSHDAWTFGAQYSHRDDDIDFFGFDASRQQDRAVGTANYALGPGILIDAEVGYTWTDTDPEDALIFGFDDYDAVEIGIGTAITF